MPSGLTVWKKIAPLMMPSANSAPKACVRGTSTSTEATISMVATNRRKGFSPPGVPSQSERMVNR